MVKLYEYKFDGRLICETGYIAELYKKQSGEYYNLVRVIDDDSIERKIWKGCNLCIRIRGI